MYTVITTYDISLKTLALLPARKIDYDTIVIKENGTKYVRQTSFALIKEACLKHDWTTYEGRRKAVLHHTKFEKKTPIPISIHPNIPIISGLPVTIFYRLGKYHNNKQPNKRSPLFALKIGKNLHLMFLFIR